MYQEEDKFPGYYSATKVCRYLEPSKWFGCKSSGKNIMIEAIMKYKSLLPRGTIRFKDYECSWKTIQGMRIKIDALDLIKRIIILEAYDRGSETKTMTEYLKDNETKIAEVFKKIRTGEGLC